MVVSLKGIRDALVGGLSGSSKATSKDSWYDEANSTSVSLGTITGSGGGGSGITLGSGGSAGYSISVSNVAIGTTNIPGTWTNTIFPYNTVVQGGGPNMTAQTQTTSSTVTIETAADLLKECITEGISPFFWGAPGIGKTEMVRQVAKELGIGCRTFIASIKQPVDLAGIPVPDLKNKTAVWLRPSDFPNEERDGKRGIFFVDEINTSVPSMQAACFQLIQERRVGDHYLGDGWIPVGAGNRMSDRAAAQRMPSALKNRFAHFNVEPDIEAWAKWANTQGIDPYLVAFLRFRPGLLHAMPQNDDNSYPTPRSWVKAAKFLNRPTATRLHLITSLVGQGPATEFEAFLRVAHSLPTLSEIESDPMTAKLPTDPAGKYAAASMLARSANRKNFPILAAYASRLGREFEVLAMVDAVKRQPDLTNTSTFASWATANQDVQI